MNATLTSATVGIENSTGTDGLQIVYNAAYVSNGLAVKISADPDWLANDISSGTIYNGNSLDVLLTFSSEDFALGTYTMDIVINSNDPVNLTITIPVTMEIANIFELTPFSALIEGLYNGTSMVSDTVTIELRNISAPYTLVDQTKILLDSNGQGNGNFYDAVNGTPYYIVLKHRNAVETWSAVPQTFTTNILTYDFTTGQNKAYGNNLKLIGTKWCIYGGDVNQNGIIDNVDLNLVFMDNVNGANGNVTTDLNGDMFTEIEDMNIVFTNSVLGVLRKTPQDYVASKEKIIEKQLNMEK